MNGEEEERGGKRGFGHGGLSQARSGAVLALQPFDGVNFAERMTMLCRPCTSIGASLADWKKVLNAMDSRLEPIPARRKIKSYQPKTHARKYICRSILRMISRASQLVVKNQSCSV